MNKKKLFSIMLFVVLLFSACSETISTSSSFSEAPIPHESFDTSIPEVVDTLNINSDVRIDFFQSKNSTDVKRAAINSLPDHVKNVNDFDDPNKRNYWRDRR